MDKSEVLEFPFENNLLINDKIITYLKAIVKIGFGIGIVFIIQTVLQISGNLTTLNQIKNT